MIHFYEKENVYVLPLHRSVKIAMITIQGVFRCYKSIERLIQMRAVVLEIVNESFEKN